MVEIRKAIIDKGFTINDEWDSISSDHTTHYIQFNKCYCVSRSIHTSWQTSYVLSKDYKTFQRFLYQGLYEDRLIETIKGLKK